MPKKKNASVESAPQTEGATPVGSPDATESIAAEAAQSDASVGGEPVAARENDATGAEKATKKKSIRLPLSEFPIQIKMPADEGAEETIITIGVGISYAIARYAAYSIAARGVPARWLKQREREEDSLVYHAISPDAVHGKNQAHINAVINEAKADRAIFVSSEMRSRARIGNMQGELAAIARDASNPSFRMAVREAMGALADALILPITPSDMLSYGIDWVDGYSDHILAAQEAWGVDPEVCPGCGEIHDDPDFAETLLAEVYDAEYEFGDEAPVA